MFGLSLATYSYQRASLVSRCAPEAISLLSPTSAVPPGHYLSAGPWISVLPLMACLLAGRPYAERQTTEC